MCCDVAVGAVPPPTTIIVGIALAALLILLLLALLLGLLYRRRHQPNDDSSASSGDELYEEPNSFDNVSLNNGMIHGDPPLKSAGNHNEAFEAVDAEALGSAAPGTEVSPEEVPPALVGTGIVITSGVRTIDKRKRFKKQPGAPPPPPTKHNATPDPAEFELTTDKKVATVIHRLATRLRNRLSSVRFSGHDRPRLDDGENGLDPRDSQGADPVQDGCRKPEKKKARPIIDIPDKPHKMPRGYAPASHNRPREVRTTWGKAKCHAELHHNADMGNKFGMQVWRMLCDPVCKVMWFSHMTTMAKSRDLDIYSQKA